MKSQSAKQEFKNHGDKQTCRINYFETYIPVLTWFAKRLLIIFAILLKWALKQVDFIMAYTQALIDMDVYMELPAGIETKHVDSKSHVLKFLKNYYCQKWADQVWNEFLTNCLLLALCSQLWMSVCYIEGW